MCRTSWFLERGDPESLLGFSCHALSKTGWKAWISPRLGKNTATWHHGPIIIQGLRLMLVNSRNVSDFDNLWVRKISTSKLSRVRIIHVSQTFGESCLNARRNVRTTPKANKTVDTELRKARFLLATGQRHCTEALCYTCTFVWRCCSSCFWSYRFHYICQK